ncbi:hypothetical protein ACWDUX_15645 [Streptomyces sp. NPDC003444]
MLEGISDGAYVRRVIWDRFPDFREDVLALESDEEELLGDIENFEVNPYSLISEIFMEKILLPSLKSSDVELIVGSSRTIEDLLDEERGSVIEMVNIRIVDYLLGFPECWIAFRRFAGPRLTRQVSIRGRYFTSD